MATLEEMRKKDLSNTGWSLSKDLWSKLIEIEKRIEKLEAKT